MRLVPPRTHASDLTDDELILFDFLWDTVSPERFLYGERLRVSANTPHSHSIPDAQLCSRLLALIERNLLCMRAPNPVLAQLWRTQEAFGLTKQGLDLWEAERLPDWSAYICEGGDDDVLTLAAVSRRVGLQAIDVCRSSGVWDVADAEPTHRIGHQVELVPWRTFAEVHYLTVPMQPHRGRQPDWSSYESRRTWWRFTAEVRLPGLAADA